MDSSAVVKKTIECQKAVFNASYNTMVILQNHTEKMTNSILEQNNATSVDAIPVYAETLANYKKGREEFKRIVDESFTQVESLFAG